MNREYLRLKEIIEQTFKMEFVSDDQRKAVFANLADNGKINSDKSKVTKEELKSWKKAEIDRTTYSQDTKKYSIAKTEGFTNGNGLGVYAVARGNWVITHQGTGVSIPGGYNNSKNAIAVATLLSKNFDFKNAKTIYSDYLGAKTMAPDDLQKFSKVYFNLQNKSGYSGYDLDGWAKSIIEGAE